MRNKKAKILRRAAKAMSSKEPWERYVQHKVTGSIWLMNCGKQFYRVLKNYYKK